MENTEILITKNWLNKVVVGLNFCPFAGREVKRGSIRFQVIESHNFTDLKEALVAEFEKLTNEPELETTLLIYPSQFLKFDDFLDWASFAEGLLVELGYEGIFQVASFHPDYMFEGSNFLDAANYTNRSPFAMLHLLREESLEKAIENHPNAYQIPDTNIAVAREKGLAQMKLLLQSCFLSNN